MICSNIMKPKPTELVLFPEFSREVILNQIQAARSEELSNIQSITLVRQSVLFDDGDVDVDVDKSVWLALTDLIFDTFEYRQWETFVCNFSYIGDEEQKNYAVHNKILCRWFDQFEDQLVERFGLTFENSSSSSFNAYSKNHLSGSWFDRIEGSIGFTFHNTRIVDGRMKELHRASRDGSLEDVLLILKDKGTDGETPELQPDPSPTLSPHVLLNQATANYGWTSLHLACYNRHLEVVEVLVRSGADMALRVQNGDTPLLCACRENRRAHVLDQLRECVSDYSLEDGKRTFDYGRSTEKIVRYLVQEGGKKATVVDAKNHAQETALHLIVNSESLCEYYKLKIIRFLVAYCDADVLEQDSNGKTPYQRALEEQDANKRVLLYLKGQEVGIQWSRVP